MFENRPMVGIGVDLCSIPRIERAMAKEGFLPRICTEAEIAYLDGKGRGRAQSAAAMFAAKEAASKALGTGIAQGVSFQDIEVTHTENGAPGLVLHGTAREMMEKRGGSGMLLSLSHEGETAIAFAVMI